MAWNEPGKGSRDPWSKPPSRPPSQGGGLDKWLQQLKTQFSKRPRRPRSWLGVGLAALIAWLLVACYVRIDDGQIGVVTRLGHYARTLDAGVHWRLPHPFETLTRLNMAGERAEFGSVQALTADRGLVELRFTMRYQVADPQQYVFAAATPEAVLRDATAAALRHALGSHNLDQVLSATALNQAIPNLRAAIQARVDQHPVGLTLMGLNLQAVEPPAALHDVYAAITAARATGDAAKDQANTQAGKIVAAAQLDAQRLLEAAQADQQARVASAQSEVAGFNALLPAYRQNPGLTKHSLWLAASSQVLAANAKVVDSSGQAVIHLAVGGRAPVAAPAAASSSGKDKQP